MTFIKFWWLFAGLLLSGHVLVGLVGNVLKLPVMQGPETMASLIARQQKIYRGLVPFRLFLTTTRSTEYIGNNTTRYTYTTNYTGSAESAPLARALLNYNTKLMKKIDDKSTAHALGNGALIGVCDVVLRRLFSANYSFKNSLPMLVAIIGLEGYNFVKYRKLQGIGIDTKPHSLFSGGEVCRGSILSGFSAAASSAMTHCVIDRLGSVPEHAATSPLASPITF